MKSDKNLKMLTQILNVTEGIVSQPHCVILYQQIQKTVFSGHAMTAIEV